MTVWAFATARRHDERLFHGLAGPMLPMIHGANCQELANAAWAFSTAGCRHDRLFTELAQKALQQLGGFKPQELSNMLWAFAASGFFYEEFFVSAARAAQFLELQAQQLANVLWALTRVRPRHHATQAAVLALLPRCIWLLDTFKPQELSSVALATAKSFGRCGDRSNAVATAGGKLELAVALARQEAALPMQVADFFTAVLPRVLPRLQAFSGQSLANLVWSLIAVQPGSEVERALLPRLARAAAGSAAALEPSALLLLLRHLPAARDATCDECVRLLFLEAQRRVDKLKLKELQILSRICASLLGMRRTVGGYSCEELRRYCQVLSQAQSWTVAALEDVDDALLESGVQGNDTSAESACSRPSSKSRAKAGPGEAKGPVPPAQGPAQNPPQGPGDGEDLAAGGEAASALAMQIPYSVKNTFLHVDDDVEVDEESDENDPARHLPPSLGIIPDSVSPEKLAAYRADYQRFRQGKAVGAKGELASSVATAAEEGDEPLSDACASRSDPAPSEPGSAQAKMLPPPLAFMPRYISLPKLEAYRIDYQNFRTGNAIGAKGEVAHRVSQDEDDTAPAKGVRRLPPPLDIHPRDVSPRRLEAYRLDYQRFRKGDGRGAKGEVVQAVARDAEPRFIALGELSAYSVGDLRFHGSAATGRAASSSAAAAAALRSLPGEAAVGGHTGGRASFAATAASLHGGSGGLPCRPAAPPAEAVPPPESVATATSADAGSRQHPPPSQPAPPHCGTAAAAAAAAAEGGNGDGQEAEECGRPEVQVALSVKNTFLHFEEAACEEAEGACTDEQLARLPPPLPIIPDNVSAEKLEAYRMDYQKFRAGNAVGAKGEVSSSVAEDP